MAIHPDIRDEAYQFFIQESTDLLDAIERGILTLRQNRNTTNVHELMRAAHSLKGGAASVGLKAITTMAHRLESIFKVFYDDSIDIPPLLERQLLQAYDCLRLPLKQQLEVGGFDHDNALAIAEPIFSQLEHQFQDVLVAVENYVPTSSDLGVDMVASIFEVDVTQALDYLAQVVADPQHYDVVQEVGDKMGVFGEFAEIFNLKGLGTIAESVNVALQHHPNQGVAIAQLAIREVASVRQAVLSGDRAPAVVLCPELQALLVPAMSFEIDHRIDDRATLPTHNTPPFHDTPSFHDTPPLGPSDDSDDTLDLISIFDDFAQLHTSETSLPELTTEPPASKESKGSNDEASHHDGTSNNADTFLDAIDQLLTDFPDFPDPSDSPDPNARFPIPTNGQISGQGMVEMEHHTLDAEFEELDIDPQWDDYRLLMDLEIMDGLQETWRSLEIVDVAQDNRMNLEIADGLQEKRIVPFLSAQQANGNESQKPALLTPSERSPQSIQPSSPQLSSPSPPPSQPKKSSPRYSQKGITSGNTIRVDADRLERMNNLVGELAINREGLALQNDQLQAGVHELLKRFSRFQNLVGSLRDVSDQMLVAPEQYGYHSFRPPHSPNTLREDQGEGVLEASPFIKDRSRTGYTRSQSHGFGAIAERLSTEFDALEMDQYGVLHAKIQSILEELVQLEESVEDIKLFSQQSDQTIDKQRYKLTHLRDELVWARMLPMGNILNRFPRMLRDLSMTHDKPVELRLIGTGVLVDKGILEKLYDPLLHLIRNAFDHGIEAASLRRQQGKSEQGNIDIRAFHQGNQTVIEVTDDGQGIDYNAIRDRLLELGWASIEQLSAMSPEHLLEFLFLPGFSTTRQVSQLSGRGIGLDVVRSQLKAIKGTVTITSQPNQGTTFTLYLPLRLTIAKLIICLVGPMALAFPSDSIEEILTPRPNQVSQSTNQRFLNWKNQIIPIHRLTDLLDYNCPLPNTIESKALSTVSTPEGWPSPMLTFRREQEFFALEVDRLVNEQELVIKPFGEGIPSPKYAYGSAILGDGSLVPVLDASVLLTASRKAKSATKMLGAMHSPPALHPASGYPVSIGPTPRADQSEREAHHSSQGDFRSIMQQGVPHSPPLNHNPIPRPLQTPTILVVDDAVTIRRTLSLSLTRSGFRVLQASDGREALAQLQQPLTINLVVCDIEMPNMNGFEFLTHRRQDPNLASIPTVMLTSRSNDKHRRLATCLGATDYFTKPYLEHEFLTAIKDLVESHETALHRGC